MSNPSAILGDFFQREHIECFAALPMESTPADPGRLSRLSLGFAPVTAILFLIPYYTGAGENLSAYAVSRDYHRFAAELEGRLTETVTAELPAYRFRLLADKSPLDERLAAAISGLGVIGDNGLLISPRYGSYVFLGSILTDLPSHLLDFTVSPTEVGECLHCGRCRACCPTGVLTDYSAPCLSALTQKKGTLTDEEAAIIRRGGSVWGCDVCQASCPMNLRALTDGEGYTPIPFFHEDRVTRLTTPLLLAMTEEEFSARAFSWRGIAPLLRNLELFGI